MGVYGNGKKYRNRGTYMKFGTSYAEHPIYNHRQQKHQILGECKKLENVGLTDSIELSPSCKATSS
jgi:hypothetical protein